MRNVEICQTCHVGQLQARLTTYAAWHLITDRDGTTQRAFIVAPGIPAWKCSVCGTRLFDREAIERVVMLVGPPLELSSAGEWAGLAHRLAAGPGDGSPLRRAQ